MPDVTEKDRVKTTLNEVRSLVLGVQILLGFQYRGAFEPGFAHLPWPARALHVAAMLALVLSLTLLVAASPYHRIAEDGEATASMERYAKTMAVAALIPFALGLGGNLGVALQGQLGWPGACLTGAGIAAATLFLWFAPAIRPRRPGRPKEDETVSIKEKVSELLTEGRIVLPGVQALLGFQFASYLTETFSKLSPLARAVNSASLVCLIGAMVALMAMAPFHQLVEGGEDTPHFERVARRLVLVSLPFLVLGVAGDVFVVSQLVFGAAAGAAVAGVCAATMLAVWFGLPMLARSKNR